jgi:TonB family protein
MRNQKDFSVGLRMLAGGVGLCTALLVPDSPPARDGVSADVRDWLSAVVTKIANGDGGKANPLKPRIACDMIVHVQIAADGFVNRVEVEQTSGSRDCEERAKSLVRTASPFNPPPAALLTKAGTTELSFPLQFDR